MIICFAIYPVFLTIKCLCVHSLDTRNMIIRSVQKNDYRLLPVLMYLRKNTYVQGPEGLEFHRTHVSVAFDRIPAQALQRETLAS